MGLLKFHKMMSSLMSQVKKSRDFKNLTKHTYCLTVGTTKKFNPNYFGWYYESCTRCIKSSKSTVGSYKCSCGEDVVAPLTR